MLHGAAMQSAGWCRLQACCGLGVSMGRRCQAASMHALHGAARHIAQLLCQGCTSIPAECIVSSRTGGDLDQPWITAGGS